MTAIQKDLTDRIMVNYRTDLITYLDFILLKICKLDAQSKKS